MMGQQWHQLYHIQTDNHASTSPLSFYRPDALPAAQPTASKHCSAIPNSNLISAWVLGIGPNKLCQLGMFEIYLPHKGISLVRFVRNFKSLWAIWSFLLNEQQSYKQCNYFPQIFQAVSNKTIDHIQKSQAMPKCHNNDCRYWTANAVGAETIVFVSVSISLQLLHFSLISGGLFACRPDQHSELRNHSLLHW